MLAVCPLPWLLAPVGPDDPICRWQVIGLQHEPATAVGFPVRDRHVLYGLRRQDYECFMRNQLPHPHEWFAPMDRLSA